MNDSDLVTRDPDGQELRKQAVHDICRDVGGDQEEFPTSGLTHLDDVTDAGLTIQLRQDARQSCDGRVDLKGEHLPACSS
jgi:hypothetical protein